MNRGTTPMKRGKIKAKRDSRMEAWSKAVRARDPFCVRCGKPSEQSHHIATRKRRPDLKYELSNGVGLDSQCHQWVHDHPIEATAAGLLSDESYEKANGGAVP